MVSWNNMILYSITAVQYNTLYLVQVHTSNGVLCCLKPSVIHSYKFLIFPEYVILSFIMFLQAISVEMHFSSFVFENSAVKVPSCQAHPNPWYTNTGQLFSLQLF